VGAAAGIWDVMKNGLYSIHVTLLDGRIGKGSGVILFRDGQILGGDAYLFYTGSYTVKGDTFKGEVLVQRHTSPRDNDNPLELSHVVYEKLTQAMARGWGDDDCDAVVKLQEEKSGVELRF
jgi:hypothetical protein